MEIFALIISLVSLAVAIAVGVAQTRIQQRLLEVEKGRDQESADKARKAVLRAELLDGENGQMLLRISNHGAAHARHIKVKLDHAPIEEHPTVMSDQNSPTVIGPGSYYEYLLWITFDSRPPTEVCVTWQDDSEVPGRFETSL